LETKSFEHDNTFFQVQTDIDSTLMNMQLVRTTAERTKGRVTELSELVEENHEKRIKDLEERPSGDSGDLREKVERLFVVKADRSDLDDLNKKIALLQGDTGPDLDKMLADLVSKKDF
jgi:hypothetical protein